MPSESGAVPGDTSGSAVETSVPVPGAGSPRAWLCFIEWENSQERNGGQDRSDQSQDKRVFQSLERRE